MLHFKRVLNWDQTFLLRISNFLLSVDVFLLILGLGCQVVYPEWSRLDGFYVVNIKIGFKTASGQILDIFFTGDLFLLRWFKW